MEERTIKYDYTELNEMLNFYSPNNIAAKLDRVAVCMTRCCLSLSDDERHMFPRIIGMYRVSCRIELRFKEYNPCKITVLWQQE